MPMKASEGSGIIWCHDSGNACVVRVDEAGELVTSNRDLFARVAETSPVYDRDLATLSGRLNSLVSAVRLRPRGNDAGQLRIGFLQTGGGFVPVPKRLVTPGEKLGELVETGTLTDLDAMSLDQRDAYLRVDRADARAGTWYAYTREDGGIVCSGSGAGCYVSVVAADVGRKSIKFFTSVEDDSPVYDADLKILSDRLNAAVESAQTTSASRPTAESKIGLVITGAGLLPVWKQVVDRPIVSGPTSPPTLQEIDRDLQVLR